MIKCPHCGDITVEEYETEYFEDSPNEVLVVRHYFVAVVAACPILVLLLIKKMAKKNWRVFNYDTLPPLR